MRPRSSHRLRFCLCLLLGAALPPVGCNQALAGQNPPPARSKPIPGAAIFDHPTVSRFHIQLTRAAYESLQRDGRRDTNATVTIGEVTLTNVAIHLKGAAGSFRSIDDRPALTLSFGKYAKGQRWNGLRKVHLNNSVQDDSLLCEYLSSDLFRAAGVPTPRVAHATVRLNDRDLGLYVLKEGWTDEFLALFFEKTTGNLYDGGFVRDIDSNLELEQGKGVTDRSDLKALAAAAREEDNGRRWERLRATLDTDRFARYLAISYFLGDWDGYALNRNNYRVYFDPAHGKAVFMPHGMDQEFQRNDLELDPWPSALVANGFIDCPEGRALYHEYARQLFTNVFRLERMTNAIAQVTAALRPFDEHIGQRTSWLQQRVQMRHRRVARDELLHPPPGMIPGQPFALNDWRSQGAGDAITEEGKDPEGRRVLRITARGSSPGSWRTSLRLRRGRYAFEARARTADVVPSPDEKGEGAGLRISGGNMGAPGLKGSTRWTRLRQEFAVEEHEREITFIAELRASRGQVDFDASSFTVVRLP